MWSCLQTAEIDIRIFTFLFSVCLFKFIGLSFCHSFHFLCQFTLFCFDVSLHTCHIFSPFIIILLRSFCFLLLFFSFTVCLFVGRSSGKNVISYFWLVWSKRKMTSVLTFFSFFFSNIVYSPMGFYPMATNCKFVFRFSWMKINIWEEMCW